MPECNESSAASASDNVTQKASNCPDSPLRELLIELARWSRVAERNGDLHARIASALALDEERRELGRDASAAGEDGAA